ncbi:hypothetical protein FRB94_013709 [Tulasnella sp. JGI-2019a]|nr:hypothetical protein FRB93_011123 [Tulasnella sp. JGI-2019a]KAG8990132.1 hypothetical protein FRB94_013709 [Tulasnella sp. JGI-2019a]
MECPKGLELFKKLDDFKLPASILTLSSTNLWDPCNLTAAVQALADRADLFVDKDVNDIGTHWHTICVTFNKIAINKSDGNTKEAVQRRGPDDMAMVAFTLRGPTSLNLKIEERVHLCRSESIDFPTPVAIADLLIISPPLAMEKKLAASHHATNARPHLFWGTKHADISIILFAAEFKRKVADINRNQLIMDLSAAQYHRRALGLTQEVLFGAISVDGLLQFYASQWAPFRGEEAETEAIFIYPVGSRYDISQPIPYLQCHSILCNMKDQHFDVMVKAFQAKKGANIAVAAMANPWLAPIPSKSTTTSAASASEPQSNANNAQGSGTVPKSRNQFLVDGNAGGASCIDGGHPLTVEALVQLSDGDSESLPLHIWRDVLMYPPQHGNQPAL